MKKINTGFSLLELLVVVAIIGVLAAIGTIGYGNYIQSTKEKALDANLNNISKLLETDLSANSLNDSADLTCLALIERVAKDNNLSAKNVFTESLSTPTDRIYKVAHNFNTFPPRFKQGQYLLMCGDMTAKPEESKIIVCSCEESAGCAADGSNMTDICPIPQQNPTPTLRED